MIKAIIFDLDGLLVDTEIVSYEIYKKLLLKFGFNFSTQEYSKHYSGKTETSNIEHLIDTYSLPLSLEVGLAKCLKMEESMIEQGVPLKKGARNLLEYLKKNNYKVAVASSSTKERAIKLLKQNHIHNLFDEFVFAEDVTNSKPHPEVFIKAYKKLNCQPSECIVLEDSENGIMAAFNATIPVICVPDMKSPSKIYLEKCIEIFPSLYEVISFLENKD